MSSDASVSGFDAKRFLASVSSKPGVYQMCDKHKKVLYVGKAKNLKSRLSSYFGNRGLSKKIINLVARIDHIQVTVTSDEAQALILEQNLIKEHSPPYNVLLKDDKSYPYIFLSGHTHPRLAFHRGARGKQGEYFGPYPNTTAVRYSLNLLQKVFKVRQCEDSYYANRSRPCLQYQINRCLAPCCFKVDEKYRSAVNYTRDFLQGRSNQVLAELAEKMELKASQLAFEEAAEIRDQIQQLQYVQSKQGFDGERGNLDVLALASRAGQYCVHVLYVRDGRVLGSRSFYPRQKTETDDSSVLEGFISQRYLHDGALPDELVLSHALDEATGLEQALSMLHGRKLSIAKAVRGQRAKWLELCKKNARENLLLRLNTSRDSLKRLEALQSVLDLNAPPRRMECFDISHHGGSQTVASCVVFSHTGPEKKAYRQFNIQGITEGDDYAALAQAVERRYRRVLKEQGELPDILFIDGGKGQLSTVAEVMANLNLDAVLLIGVAKGVTRKAGFEVLHFSDGREIQLPPHSPALHLIQHIRDEAHRFALRAHKNRKRSAQQSILETVPGVGPKRRRELLRHFGGLQQIYAASEEELMKVAGINKKTAALIYAKLHA